VSLREKVQERRVVEGLPCCCCWLFGSAERDVADFDVAKHLEIELGPGMVDAPPHLGKACHSNIRHEPGVEIVWCFPSIEDPQ